MYPIVTVFGKELGVYAICSIIGLLLCGFVAAKLTKHLELYSEDITILMLFIAGGMLLGGHLLFGITNIGKMHSAFVNAAEIDIANVLSILSSGFGGMVFYGGFFGACGALFIYAKFTHFKDKRRLFDVLAVCVPLFHVFGRIGCFFGGCCYGIESSFGFIVYNNTLSPGINGVIRFPVQLVEAACNLLIFIVILIMYKRNKLTGRLILLYMLIYSVVRFLLEFLRDDEIRGIWFGLSTSQWISICLFLFSSANLILFQIKQLCACKTLQSTCFDDSTPKTVSEIND